MSLFPKKVQYPFKAGLGMAIYRSWPVYAHFLCYRY